MKKIFLIVLIIAAIFVGGTSAIFIPHAARAQSAPVVVVTGTLTNVGDQVLVTNLVGQSTCSFFVSTGSPGAVDVQGTNDRAASPAWTTIAALDYAAPPGVQVQPFTPNVGQAYQFSPTSLTRARVVADATWSGGPATVIITCSGAVARVNQPGGGGGGSVTGTDPILVADGTAISFDYAFAGKFSASQSINGAITSCGSQPPSLYFGNTDAPSTTNGTIWLDGSSNFNFGMTYNPAHGCAPTNIAIQINASGNSPTISFPEVPGNVLLPSFADGCVFLQGGSLETTSDGSTCVTGGTAIAGTNIIVTATSSPAGGQIISLVPQPVVSNIDFTDTALLPNTYAGLAADGTGQVKVVSIAVSPCPTTGCGVQGVTGTSPISVTAGLIPNASLGIVPRTLGGLGVDSHLFPDGDCILTSGTGTTFTPAPCATPSTPNTVTVTSPLALSTATPHVFALSLLLGPPNLGFLGVDATTFTNGQCPGWNTGLGHFTGVPCSSATPTPYTAGLNLALAANQFSVVSSPVFAGAITGNFISPINLNQTEIPALHLGTGAAGSGSVSAPNLTSVDTYSYNTGLLAQVWGTTQSSYVVSSGTFISDGIVPYTHSGTLDFQAIARSMGLRFSRGSGAPGNICVNSNNTSSLVASGYAFTCLQQFFGDGTSVFPAQVTIESVAVNPRKGQLSCSLTAASSCTATVAVVAGSRCNATYDTSSVSGLLAGVLSPLSVDVTTTTLTITMRTASVTTATPAADYLCL